MTIFKKQFIFIISATAIIVVGALVIRGANIVIPTGYNQTGAGAPVAWWKMDEAGHNFQFLIFNF